ncbi:rcc01693 family protein [Sinorhizobium sp. BG8]|uniref:rcc01693 family protein n=1 Tax=Sinorhizobium sp. BG8 TaxID=2613773 RepID=UPI00193D32ED|nr:rcc01693 family protein [Sinorhizobium sp. BG8]QRM54757.1 phage tail assembly chaperone [Sinorhizobium sp. BG8]
MTAEPLPFPWDAVLHAGLAGLRLSPREFWSLTPRELHAALGGRSPRAGTPDRAGLEALMRAFPDASPAA